MIRYINKNNIFASIDHYCVLRGMIQYRCDGSSYLTGLYKIGHDGMKSKTVACGYVSCEENMVSAIKKKCYSNGLFMDTEPRTPRRKAFICSECSIPRDILRNTYDITRSKDSADTIIIPEPVIRGKCEAVAMFIMRSNGFDKIIIIDISLYDNTTKYSTFPKTKEDYIKVISVKEPDFTDENVEVVFISDFNKSFGNDFEIVRNMHRSVYFLNRCEDYIDVLADPWHRCDRRVLEHNVQYDAPVKISPDVLQIWENMDDTDLLSRNIAASDWVEYPITTCVAIANSVITDNYKLGDYNNAFQDILKTLNPYETIRKIKYGPLDISISPKDLDMVQEYLFQKIGVKDDKAFISIDDISNLRHYEYALVLKRYAVAKAKITQTTQLGEIFKQ